MVAATVRNTQRLWGRRAELAATALTREAAAERLGVIPNQVTNLVASGRLVSLDHAGERLLPARQFHPDTPRGRLEGIQELVEVFPGGVLSLVVVGDHASSDARRSYPRSGARRR